MNDRQAPPEVSVVVPAYNQANLLVRLLDSLVAAENSVTWEVIVVDDASPDDTRAAVARWREANPAVACHYFRQEVNRGPGAARNRGLAEARGAVVAFTDTDCVVGPGWLDHLLAALEGEQIVGAGGAVAALNPEGLYARYNTVNGSLEPIVSADYAIPYLVTCNCCYRREALLAAGGFSEDIETPGGEDVAASIVLYKQGLRFAFAPEARVQLDYRENLRRFMRTWTNYGYGCGFVAERLLSPEERNPEWGQWDAENYWGIQAIRPTVTGLRSLWKDVRWFWGRCSGNTAATGYRLRLAALRVVERLCYYRGWRRGVARARRA